MNWESEGDWLAAANAAGVTGFMHPCELAKLVELAEGGSHDRSVGGIFAEQGQAP